MVCHNYIAATGDAPYLYPNPSDQFINIAFNQAATRDWQVDLLAANGSLLQRKSFINVSSAHINFQQLLANGVYFARATDLQTRKNHVLSFLVRRFLSMQSSINTPAVFFGFRKQTHLLSAPALGVSSSNSKPAAASLFISAFRSATAKAR